MDSPYEPPKAPPEVGQPEPQTRHSWRFWTSLVYLSLGFLGLVGFLAAFLNWYRPLAALFLLGLPFYLFTITYTIWIHPLLCTISLLTRKTNNSLKDKLVITLFSYALASGFTYLVMVEGFYLSA